MKTKDATKIRIKQLSTKLTSKIIEGTNTVDRNGEFNYSNEDLLNLCTLNKLSETIKPE